MEMANIPNSPQPVHNPYLQGLPNMELHERPSDFNESDFFRMYCYKVVRCTKNFNHDWTKCQFAHATENARRRDPRVVNYLPIACEAYKRDQFCEKGDTCGHAHGVFEVFLHPLKYRTQMCKDGPSRCDKPVCFFAHFPWELRVCNQPAQPLPGAEIYHEQGVSHPGVPGMSAAEKYWGENLNELTLEGPNSPTSPGISAHRRQGAYPLPQQQQQEGEYMSPQQGLRKPKMQPWQPQRASRPPEIAPPLPQMNLPMPPPQEVPYLRPISNIMPPQQAPVMSLEDAAKVMHEANVAALGSNLRPEPRISNARMRQMRELLQEPGPPSPVHLNAPPSPRGGSRGSPQMQHGGPRGPSNGGPREYAPADSQGGAFSTADPAGQAIQALAALSPEVLNEVVMLVNNLPPLSRSVSSAGLPSPGTSPGGESIIRGGGLDPVMHHLPPPGASSPNLGGLSRRQSAAFGGPAGEPIIRGISAGDGEPMYGTGGSILPAGMPAGEGLVRVGSLAGGDAAMLRSRNSFDQEVPGEQHGAFGSPSEVSGPGSFGDQLVSAPSLRKEGSLQRPIGPSSSGTVNLESLKMYWTPSP